MESDDEVDDDEMALTELIKQGDLKSLVHMKDVEPVRFLKTIESFGSFLMDTAVELDQFRIAEYLLVNNCRWVTAGEFGGSILHDVAKNECASSFIQNLLKRNAVDVNGTDSFDSTPLHLACEGGVSRNVEILLKNGAKCDAMNHLDESPLYLAVSGYHVECVRVLLESGADVNFVCNRDREDYDDGCTALNSILLNLLETVPRFEVLRALCSSWPFSGEEVLSNLKTLETHDENNVSTDWDRVARQLEIIHLLLKYDKLVCQSEKKVVVRYLRILEEFCANSNFDEESEPNGSMMDTFIIVSCPTLVEVLMKHSEDPDKVSSELSSLLMKELKYSPPSFKFVDLLFQLGADVNAIDYSDNQNTPLHLAVINRYDNDLNVKLLRILAKRVTTIDLRDRDGYTPFMRSVEQKTCTFELAKLFVELKADTTLLSNDGHSIWGLALQTRDPYILNHLVCCGLNWEMKEECSSFNIFPILAIGYYMSSKTLLSVSRLLYSDAIYKKRLELIESFVGEHFPISFSNHFNYVTCCVESLRGSSIVRELCISSCDFGGAAIFVVEAENYILRTYAMSLDEYCLSLLLGHRIQRPQGSYLDELQKEIDLMGAHIVWGSLTLHQLIQSNDDQLLSILENVEALDSILPFLESSYPIMSYVIKERCRDIISSLNLLAAASSTINSILSTTMLPFSSFSTLPDLIIRQIFSHLSKSDLCNLILGHLGMTEDLRNDLEKLWLENLKILMEEIKQIC